MLTADTEPNLFDEASAEDLFDRLTADQKEIAELKLIVPANYDLISKLPRNRKELLSIAVLISEALILKEKYWAIPLVQFKIVGEAHQGVFTIPNYNNYTCKGVYLRPTGKDTRNWCDCLTEDLKECSQYQELPQELANLIDWLVD